MRLSRYFLPILRETPKEAEIVSHRLMLRAGMIRQQAAGIYSWLPFGKRVLENVNTIIREEQDRSGAIELLMPTIQSADLWRESRRYDDYGKEMLRIEDRHGRDMLFGPTNEEMITDIFRASVRSYRDLPLNLYHIQWKFRGRSPASFRSHAFARVPYERCLFIRPGQGFLRVRPTTACSSPILGRSTVFGLRPIPMRAESGPIGGDMSHEFIILAETGESEVYCDRSLLDLPIPSEDTDYDADLSPIVDAWTAPYAATEEMHDPKAFERLGGGTSGSLPEASRSATSSILAISILNRWAPL